MIDGGEYRPHEQSSDGRLLRCPTSEDKLKKRVPDAGRSILWYCEHRSRRSAKNALGDASVKRIGEAGASLCG
jgi:hypothetical protein